MPSQMSAVQSQKQTRIEALQKRHADLEHQISEARKGASTTDFYLRQLKKLKLVLKEEIEGIHRHTASA
ncbi:MAG: DUF465 domain-containing protein [Alphaproteobacteria bacterium]|nr:DUF465 domain-containing protein [Alphaproteobacteria bacterium]